jgi:hypothetical protein
MHCENGEFPGLSRDGGFTDLMICGATRLAHDRYKIA